MTLEMVKDKLFNEESRQKENGETFEALVSKNKNGVEEAKAYFVRITKGVDQNLGQGKTSLAIIVASLDISKGITEYEKLSNQGINKQKLHKQTLQ